MALPYALGRAAGIRRILKFGPAAANDRAMRYRWLLLFVIFFTKKPPYPDPGRDIPQVQGADMGKSPHRGGGKHRFPGPAPLSPERGAESRGGGAEGQMGMGRREVRGRSTQQKTGAAKNRDGAAEHASSVLPPAVPAKKGTACRRQEESRVCLWHRAVGRAGGAGSGNCPALGRCMAHRMALAGRRANESPRRAGALRSEDGGRDTAAAIT